MIRTQSRPRPEFAGIPIPQSGDPLFFLRLGDPANRRYSGIQEAPAFAHLIRRCELKPYKGPSIRDPCLCGVHEQRRVRAPGLQEERGGTRPSASWFVGRVPSRGDPWTSAGWGHPAFKKSFQTPDPSLQSLSGWLRPGGVADEVTRQGLGTGTGERCPEAAWGHAAYTWSCQLPDDSSQRNGALNSVRDAGILRA